jgi:hypothetical protein
MIRIAVLVFSCFHSLTILAQTGYFKTPNDLVNHDIVEYDDVSWRSSALGCNVNFFKGDKKVKGFDQRDIFAFADDSIYYRFYKYAIVQMLIRGEISFFGLVPTTLSYDAEKKAFVIRGTDKMMLFFSQGPAGELIPFKRKKFLELIGSDEAILNIYKTTDIDMLGCTILYNLKHRAPDGFIMNNRKQMTYPEFEAKLNTD